MLAPAVGDAMRRTNKLLLKILAAFCGLVAFCTAAELFLACLSKMTGIEGIASLKAKDLLGSLGVFGTLAFTIASHKAELDKAKEEEEGELERATPQIDIAFSPALGGRDVSLSNMGPRPLKCLSYEDQPLTEALVPGASFTFRLVDWNLAECDSGYQQTAPKLIESSTPTEEGNFKDFFLCVYDAKDRFWVLTYEVENYQVVDNDQWLAS